MPQTPSDGEGIAIETDDARSIVSDSKFDSERRSIAETPHDEWNRIITHRVLCSLERVMQRATPLGTACLGIQCDRNYINIEISELARYSFEFKATGLRASLLHNQGNTEWGNARTSRTCLLYTSDAADE